MRGWVVAGALSLGMIGSVAHADEPTLRVKDVSVRDCNTDGGDVTCSVGTKTLAKGLLLFAQERASTCAGQKKGKYEIALTYEYNGGELYWFSHALATIHDGKVTTAPPPADSALVDAWGAPLKKAPGLPECARALLVPLAERLLTWWEVVRQIDPEVDVRSTYVVKLEVK
jgi:hypothetical protein